MARDFGFDGVEDGDEVTKDVLVGGVATVGVFAMGGVAEDVVIVEEIDMKVDMNKFSLPKDNRPYRHRETITSFAAAGVIWTAATCYRTRIILTLWTWEQIVSKIR
jgi:hypothetical protein